MNSVTQGRRVAGCHSTTMRQPRVPPRLSDEIGGGSDCLRLPVCVILL